MPPIYIALAKVVDIRRDKPRATDRVLVDTNVWAWDGYPNSGVLPSGAVAPQALEYPAYLEAARQVGAVCYRSATCYAELRHVVEKTEHEIYAASVRACTLKEYRHDPAMATERARVGAEVRRAWALVKGDGVYLPVALDDRASDDSLARFETELVDAYDCVTLSAMRAHGIDQILSDDGDFCTVAGITLFTASPRVLAAARAQGRLLTR